MVVPPNQIRENISLTPLSWAVSSEVPKKGSTSWNVNVSQRLKSKYEFHFEDNFFKRLFCGAAGIFHFVRTRLCFFYSRWFDFLALWKSRKSNFWSTFVSYFCQHWWWSWRTFVQVESIFLQASEAFSAVIEREGLLNIFCKAFWSWK